MVPSSRLESTALCGEGTCARAASESGKNIEHKTTGLHAIDDSRAKFQGPSLIIYDRRLQVLELIEIFHMAIVTC